MGCIRSGVEYPGQNARRAVAFGVATDGADAGAGDDARKGREPRGTTFLNLQRRYGASCFFPFGHAAYPDDYALLLPCSTIQRPVATS